MSKITCEVCATAYDEEAGCCPICGWVNKNKAAEEDLNLDDIRKDFLEEKEPAEKTSAAEKKNKAIFDYDAVNTKKAAEKAVQEEAGAAEEEYADEEEQHHTNVFLVIFLVILIVALLLTTGYMFVRFFLPGRNAKTEETIPPATAQIIETIPETTEEPTIPCSDLAIPDGIETMKEPGQKQMLHVVILPEDTTDTLSFASENEAIATVDAEGVVTAVAEGETNIIITCGSQSMKCPIAVHFEPETQPAETVNALTDVPETEATEAAAETTATEAAKKDVVIKLKKSDIQLGRLGVYYDLELDCDLTPEEVEWSVDNSYIANVNNGRVTVMGRGVAVVTARYGEHEATCIVRCKF